MRGDGTKPQCFITYSSEAEKVANVYVVPQKDQLVIYILIVIMHIRTLNHTMQTCLDFLSIINRMGKFEALLIH